MAILFAGCEIRDFDILSGAGPTVTTSASARDGNYARAASLVNDSSSFGKTFTANATVYFRAIVAFTSNASSSSGRALIRIASATGDVARISGTGTSAGLNMQRWDGAAWQTVATVASHVVNTTYVYVIGINIGVSGFISFWGPTDLDVPPLLGTFDGNTSALGNPNQFVLQRAATAIGDGNAFSEVIVASHDIRVARLKTLPLTGAGTNTAWSGTVTSINATGDDDTTFISETTNGDLATYVADNLFADSYRVRAVVTQTRARRNNGTPRNASSVLRSGGANYATALPTLTTSFATAPVVWETDPATSSDWARSAVDALEIGVRCDT